MQISRRLRHALEYAAVLGVREVFRHLPPERSVALVDFAMAYIPGDDPSQVLPLPESVVAIVGIDSLTRLVPTLPQVAASTSR